LVYATCSLCRDENEAVVDTFRRDHPAFQPVSLQHPATRDQLTEGRMTLLPAELDSDAYFMAAMRRV
jgi:16S rRNA (cytosine967-C5)-methyltransferase